MIISYNYCEKNSCNDTYKYNIIFLISWFTVNVAIGLVIKSFRFFSLDDFSRLNKSFFSIANFRPYMVFENGLFTITSCNKDHGASEMGLRNRHQKPIFIKRRLCWVFDRISKVLFILSCCQGTKLSIRMSTVAS